LKCKVILFLICHYSREILLIFFAPEEYVCKVQYF
jgi:hypothetical protein